jgi:hypothetical protein
LIRHKERIEMAVGRKVCSVKEAEQFLNACTQPVDCERSADYTTNLQEKREFFWWKDLRCVVRAVEAVA